MLTPGKIDVVLLCGGFGTRLKTVVHDRPKPMAEINDRPFLDILIDYVSDYGFKRFILCTGHKGDVIRKYYEAKNTQKIFLFSEEKEPLGTGGNKECRAVNTKQRLYGHEWRLVLQSGLM